MAYCRLWLLAVCLLPAAASAVSLGHGTDLPALNSVPEREWSELRVEPPAFPRQENLVEFYVGPNTANHFFIDPTTLSVGQDRVVRYVLVVRTAGGATNVTFEGMRCDTGEYKLIASGRADGTWASSRIDAWRLIENKPVNRHHAALSRDLFCPSGAAILNAEEGVDALRRGKHPLAP